MFAFELLIGPYAVAHYRLHHALAEKPKEGEPSPPPLPRLGIYLADTLAEAGTSSPAGRLGYVADEIRHERDEADRIKAEQRILAIIGNPPYWRFQGVNTREVVGPFIDDLWDDLKEPVRQAGWANQLNTFPEFSIAFWRWAIWKLFEADNAPQKGVIAFISNRTFLAGKPYAGLRKMLRERFDRIEVIDLRGDLRRGERAGVLNDEGVFNIQVGTAITLAIADGSKAEGQLASITYADCWEEKLFARRAKLDALEAAAAMGDSSRACVSSAVYSTTSDLYPSTSRDGPPVRRVSHLDPQASNPKEITSSMLQADKHSALRSIACRSAGALKSGDFQLYRTEPGRSWLSPSDGTRRSYAKQHTARWISSFTTPTLAGTTDPPALKKVWGETNVCLFVLPSGTNAGPSAWCHGLYPDRHSFRGSYGGYAFPLHDRGPGHAQINLKPELIEGLSLAYNAPVASAGCVRRYARFAVGDQLHAALCRGLGGCFAAHPLPASKEVFDRAAAVGESIREIETFERAPDPLKLTSTHRPDRDHRAESWR